MVSVKWHFHLEGELGLEGAKRQTGGDGEEGEWAGGGDIMSRWAVRKI